MYSHTDHQTNQPVLDVSHLTVRYNGHLALEDITFHLHQGERVAIVGPNGAGKSTLIKVIAGVSQPNSGEVNIFGSRPRGHVCIGYIPQRSQLEFSRQRSRCCHDGPFREAWSVELAPQKRLGFCEPLS